MGIRLAFSINREVFRIDIDNKVIYYTDRKWKKSIRLIPKDEEFIKKILLSRNSIPSILKELFKLTKEEQEEYNNAKTDEELSEICIRDIRKKGAILINKDEL